MIKIAVVLTTHSSYLDVCKNFIELFKKNWSKCKYDFWFLIIGEKSEFKEKNVIYHKNNISLPMAIYQFMQQYKYDYCISFLGDAFICSPISQAAVENIIADICEKNIDYCCLLPRVPYRFKEYKCGKYLRHITSNDVYNMCFIAFIASEKFINEEFSGIITDLEFEKKYLEETFDKTYIYDKRVILRKNVFHLEPGIDAGKWNLHAYKKLKKNNPEILFADREFSSIKMALCRDLLLFLQSFLSKKQRKKIKQLFFRILHKEFVTKY